MTKTKHDFYVYPTLVDGFNYAKISGNYQDIIDRINKVEKEMPEFVMKGAAFESCVNAKIDGINRYTHDGFTFDKELVDKIASKLRNTIKKQKWIEKTVDFEYGKIRIGGFIDYDYQDKTVDLKTCINYRLGKYEKNSQHKAYGLIEDHKKEFIYLATDLNNYYVEPYINKKKYHEEFLNDCAELYNFCKENEHLIKDTRIFGK